MKPEFDVVNLFQKKLIYLSIDTTETCFWRNAIPTLVASDITFFIKTK